MEVKEKITLEGKIMDETDSLLKLTLKMKDESIKVRIMSLLVNVKEVLNGKESSNSGKN